MAGELVWPLSCFCVDNLLLLCLISVGTGQENNNQLSEDY